MKNDNILLNKKKKWKTFLFIFKYLFELNQLDYIYNYI